MPTIANSTFLDLTSYGTTTATTVEAAYDVGNTVSRPSTKSTSLSSCRAPTIPTALLASNWATRQTTLQQLKDNGTLWSTYGATTGDYNNARAILSGHGTSHRQRRPARTDGYVTSQESRTIWVTLTPDAIRERCSAPSAYQAERPLLLERQPVGAQRPERRWPVVRHRTAGSARRRRPRTSPAAPGAVVHEGPQSIGNYLSTISQMSNYFPGAIAQDFYNFPLAGKDVATTAVGLIEPGIGDAMPSASPTFQQGLNAYRHAAGSRRRASTMSWATSPARATPRATTASDRSMSASWPRRRPAARSASIPARASTRRRMPTSFTSYQTAFWDTVNNPTVLSSSFSIFQQTNPSLGLPQRHQGAVHRRRAARHDDGAGQQRFRLELGRRHRPCQPGHQLELALHAAGRRHVAHDPRRGAFRSDDRQRSIGGAVTLRAGDGG